MICNRHHPRAPVVIICLVCWKQDTKKNGKKQKKNVFQAKEEGEQEKCFILSHFPLAFSTGAQLIDFSPVCQRHQWRCGGRLPLNGSLWRSRWCSAAMRSFSAFSFHSNLLFSPHSHSDDRTVRLPECDASDFAINGMASQKGPTCF